VGKIGIVRYRGRDRRTDRTSALGILRYSYLYLDLLYRYFHQASTSEHSDSIRTSAVPCVYPFFNWQSVPSELNVKLTAHLHLMAILRMNWDITSLTHTPSWCIHRQIPLYCCWCHRMHVVISRLSSVTTNISPHHIYEHIHSRKRFVFYFLLSWFSSVSLRNYYIL